MANIFQSYISKLFVDINRNNDDVITISTQFLSPEGDVFTLDRRTLSPNLIKTTGSLQELQPEVSDVYPFKITPPVLEDGTTELLSPTTRTPVTASQNYYVPIYFERYQPDVLRRIDKEFTELVDINEVIPTEPSPFQDSDT